MEVGALGAGGDQVGRLVERGPGRVARGVGGDQLRVVGDVVGQVGHLPDQTTIEALRFRRRATGAASGDPAGHQAQDDQRYPDDQQQARGEQQERRATRCRRFDLGLDGRRDDGRGASDRVAARVASGGPDAAVAARSRWGEAAG